MTGTGKVGSWVRAGVVAFASTLLLAGCSSNDSSGDDGGTGGAAAASASANGCELNCGPLGNCNSGVCSETCSDCNIKCSECLTSKFDCNASAEACRLQMSGFFITAKTLNCPTGSGTCQALKSGVGHLDVQCGGGPCAGTANAGTVVLNCGSAPCHATANGGTVTLNNCNQDQPCRCTVADASTCNLSCTEGDDNCSCTKSGQGQTGTCNFGQ